MEVIKRNKPSSGSLAAIAAAANYRQQNCLSIIQVGVASVGLLKLLYVHLSKNITLRLEPTVAARFHKSI